MVSLAIIATIVSLVLLSLDYFRREGSTPEYIEEIGEDLEDWINDNDRLISMDIFSADYWTGFESVPSEVQSNVAVVAFDRNMAMDTL